MSFTDYEAAWLASAVYYGGDAETFKKEVPKGWTKQECKENAETGFVCMLFTKKNQSGSGGQSVFSVMGTNSGAGSEIAKGQMKSNAKLREDSEQDRLDIVDDCIRFVRDQTWQLEEDGDWDHYLVGHSLGGYTATCATVALSDNITRCVTFESPGISKYWREKAEQKGNVDWKKKIVEYMSFPNPINTCLPHIGSVKRLHMQCQASSSPGHVIRCVVGSSLRLVVWVSVANLAFVAAKRADGFWAAKLGSVTVKLFKLMFDRKFTPKHIKQAVKDGISDDQASKDARKAKEGGKVDDPGAKPLKPILKRLPQDARPAFIVGFWALATGLFANTGYLSMRTLAQINDCMAEHNVDSIAEHFDEKTGKAKKVTDMESWPYHEVMVKSGLMGEHTRRCYLEALTPFHPTAYGMHNLMQREKVIYKRASTMPDFKEA